MRNIRWLIAWYISFYIHRLLYYIPHRWHNLEESNNSIRIIIITTNEIFHWNHNKIWIVKHSLIRNERERGIIVAKSNWRRMEVMLFIADWISNPLEFISSLHTHSRKWAIQIWCVMDSTNQFGISV